MYITSQTHGDDACFVIIVLESRDRKRVDRALAPLLNKNACGLSTRLRMDSTEDRNNDTHVRLLVKAPDQQIDDQIVQCKLDWSVAMLKDHLAQVYPGNPRHTDQKIIFSGQLLSDSMILKDVLQQYYNKDDRSFIVHLVCGGQWRESTTAKTKTNIGISGSGNTTNVQSPVNATAAPSPPQPTPVEQYYSQLNNQQMAWMQQAYAHYLTQYTQFMATQGIQFQSTSPYTRPLNAARASDAANNNNAVTNNNNAEENDDNEDRAARGARVAGPPGAAAAGDANAVNNNNNVPADEAPGGAALNRDWLDIIDMLSRIVVLSSIVYFYSSPSRFLIVTFLGFVIYLVQGGFFRGQPVFLAENNNARVENNNQLGQNEPAGQAPAAQIPPQQAPRNATAVPAGGHGEAARTNVNEENERPGAWAFTWTFFSSFFASLIPDQPNVI